MPSSDELPNLAIFDQFDKKVWLSHGLASSVASWMRSLALVLLSDRQTALQDLRGCFEESPSGLPPMYDARMQTSSQVPFKASYCGWLYSIDCRKPLTL